MQFEKYYLLRRVCYLIIHPDHIVLRIGGTKYFHQKLFIKPVENVLNNRGLRLAHVDRLYCSLIGHLEVVLSVFARQCLYPGHDVVKQSVVHLNHQTQVGVGTLLNVQEVDQPLDGATLN